jgi:integrase
VKTEKLPRGIRRRGSMLYVYLTLPDGRFHLRSVGHLTVKEAVRQREIWQREIAEAKYVKPKPRTDLVLFADICDQAIDYYKNFAKCWDAAEGRVARFKEWWPARAAESITTAEIDAQLLANTGTRGLQWSKTTANEYRSTLGRVYALAGKAGLCSLNPALSAKRHRLENNRTRELSYKEEESLRAAIRAKHPAKEVELDLALHLGCRRSNLYGQHNSKRVVIAPLQWADVNLDFRVVAFPRSKAGRGYRVPINDTALAAFKLLRERSDGTGAVIRKPRPKSGADGRELFSARRWFEACVEDAGIKDFRWHDLRHTFASRLRAHDVRLEDIRDLLGHNVNSMTARYAHSNLDALRRAVATLDQTDTNTDTAAVLQFRSA